ncbi:MAG: alpha/beta hydrolase [Dehalococcoidia bacterium]
MTLYGPIGRKENKLKIKDYAEITYIEEGKGKSPTIIQSQWYPNTYDLLVGEMAKHFHVIFIPGRFVGPFYKFDPAGNPSMMKTWAEDVYRLSRELGIDKFVYAGQCHGSHIGWQLLYDHPEVLKGFVAINKMSPWAVRSWKLLDMDPRKEFVAFIMNPKTTPEQRVEAYKKQHHPHDPAWLQRRIEAQRYMAPESRAIMNVMERPLANQIHDEVEMVAWLSKVKVPVLQVFGVQDTGLDDNLWIMNARTIPGTKMVSYQDESHFMFAEAPDKVVAEMQLFFAQKNIT